MLENASILVTGGAGFIGSHFIERLLADAAPKRVVCLDNFNDSYSPAVKQANIAGFARDPRFVRIGGDFCKATAKPGEMPITYADLGNARRLLDYQPRVSFDQGVREFVAWFCSRRLTLSHAETEKKCRKGESSCKRLRLATA